LLALLLYLEAATAATSTGRGWAYGLSVLAYTAALASFPIGLGLVPVLVILDHYPLDRFKAGPRRWWNATARKVWLEKAPYAAVALVAVSLGLMARFNPPPHWTPPASLEAFGPAHRFMQAVFLWAYYLWKPWAPVDLSPLYTTLVSFNPTDRPFIFSLLGVGGISAGALWLRRPLPALCALWACHLVVLIPMLGLTEHPHFPSDRYALIPGIVWAVGLAAGLFKLWDCRRWRNAGLLAAMAIITACGVLSHHQTRVWQNSVTLFEHTIQKLGDGVSRSGIYFRLGIVHLKQGDKAKAVECMKQAVQIDPDFPEAQTRLADILAEQGQLEEAVAHYSEALRMLPDNPRLHHQLGEVLTRLGKTGEARRHFDTEQRLTPVK
jgi:protein O-mannosyl-transferase